MRGRSSGDKNRPCALVVASRAAPDAPLRVMVCPITHTEPRPPSEGIEVPHDEKAGMGLDDKPQWIITSEVTKVNWWDKRFSQTPSGLWVYGKTSKELMTEVKTRIQSRITSGSMDIIDRPSLEKDAG